MFQFQTLPFTCFREGCREPDDRPFSNACMTPHACCCYGLRPGLLRLVIADRSRAQAQAEKALLPVSSVVLGGLAEWLYEKRCRAVPKLACPVFFAALGPLLPRTCCVAPLWRTVHRLCNATSRDPGRQLGPPVTVQAMRDEATLRIAYATSAHHARVDALKRSIGKGRAAIALEESLQRSLRLVESPVGSPWHAWVCGYPARARNQIATAAAPASGAPTARAPR